MKHRDTPGSGLGRAIARLMAKRGVNQQDLARLSGYSQSYISKIVRGRRPNPSVAVLVALAKALEVPIAMIYSEAGLDGSAVARNAKSLHFLGVYQQLSQLNQQEIDEWMLMKLARQRREAVGDVLEEGG